MSLDGITLNPSPQLAIATMETTSDIEATRTEQMRLELDTATAEVSKFAQVLKMLEYRKKILELTLAVALTKLEAPSQPIPIPEPSFPPTPQVILDELLGSPGDNFFDRDDQFENQSPSLHPHALSHTPEHTSGLNFIGDKLPAPSIPLHQSPPLRRWSEKPALVIPHGNSPPRRRGRLATAILDDGSPHQSTRISRPAHIGIPPRPLHNPSNPVLNAISHNNTHHFAQTITAKADSHAGYSPLETLSSTAPDPPNIDGYGHPSIPSDQSDCDLFLSSTSHTSGISAPTTDSFISSSASQQPSYLRSTSTTYERHTFETDPRKSAATDSSKSKKTEM
ncbi:hypothetical protein B0H13DRAFT_2310862 [Mycena leptocephala]|nr:hypothetical protein B0H13DRAFT_2310862 [Mycena leptocephala]